MIQPTDHVDTNPFANRTPHEVEQALREMGFKRYTHDQYMRDYDPYQAGRKRYRRGDATD